MVSLPTPGSGEREARSGALTHLLVLLLAAFLALAVLVGLTTVLEPWVS